ncbi:LysR substrate-binding domain-containing protein [Arhodomonas aquaeolei]|uniref:LysR substrate-binding domain-containing protein n=1 Tax=Arhodomonas TaxID=2368 RepID=UPI0021678455|nr:LysR substrate-binding domain-containing protein [Arhodomonas aquaeolei]MCS4503353.1 LysR substrate-binding domain-containing protein [Arhodomonas aquaeolei]
MPSRLPPLNPLRAFEATARRGSVSEAARELNVTHGAVSHQLRALESSLDVQLFERKAQRLKLTAQGARLLPSVSSAFEEIATAMAEIRRPSTRGDLSVSCTPALLSFWLLPRIREFNEQFPDVRLTLTSSNDPQNVHSPEHDVCILYGDGNLTDCWVRLWSNLELFPVVSPTLLNSRPLRTPRDLEQHVMLHIADHREWHAWLCALDAPDLAGRCTHHFLSDARLGLEAAVLGHGVALGDTMTASGLLSRGVLVRPFDRSVPAVDSFYVACRSEARAAPIVKVFIDWLYAARDGSNALAEPPSGTRRSGRRRSSGNVPSGAGHDDAAAATGAGAPRDGTDH